jgi:REP element-mobilizing transposase RayT
MPSPDHRPHHRRSIRLRTWDYRTAAAYFVTLCTHQRECLFFDDAWRATAETTWSDIPSHQPRVVLDEWVVMPNHLHGILILTDDGHAPVGPFNWRHPATPSMTGPRTFANAAAGSLGALVRSYKAAVTNRINHQARTLGCKRWQRGYYERIVRDDQELDRIRIYIRQNPQRWAEDRDNLAALLERMTYHNH